MVRFFWHFAITCTQQAQSPALTSQRTEVNMKWRCGHGREVMEEWFSVLNPYEQGHHTRSSGTSLPPPQHIVQPCCTAALCNSGMVKEVLGRRSCVATSIGRASASVEASDHFVLRDLQLHIEGLYIPKGRIYFFALLSHLSPPIQRTPLHRTTLRSYRAHPLSHSHSNLLFLW